jgi:hypothetical protein
LLVAVKKPPCMTQKCQNRLEDSIWAKEKIMKKISRALICHQDLLEVHVR